MPRVTIILPNYNYARYLKECVRSILRQTYRDFELIYVDDASTDESNRVIDAFRTDPRLRTILHERNSGTVYRRWNEVAAGAAGEWLWFPNADDATHPRFLETLVEEGERDGRIGIAHARNMRMDGQGRLLADRWAGHPTIMAHLDKSYRSAGYQEVLYLAEGCYLTTASSLIVRRAAFEAAGGFDERLWGCADYDLYLRILHYYDIAYSAEPLAYYRMHGENTTTSTRSAVFYLALAYCLAMTLRRMEGDSRYTPAMRDTVLRRCRARIFDAFAEPAATIPPEMDFAVREIHKVVPDKRLAARAVH
jgi:glycosyltransferase involved in cell wall biosynthesis